MCHEQRADLRFRGEDWDEGAKTLGQDLFLAAGLFRRGKSDCDGIAQLHPGNCAMAQPETGGHTLQQSRAGLVFAEIDKPQGKRICAVNPAVAKRCWGAWRRKRRRRAPSLGSVVSAFFVVLGAWRFFCALLPPLNVGARRVCPQVRRRLIVQTVRLRQLSVVMSLEIDLERTFCCWIFV